MKKYLTELVALIIQLGLFYIYPIFALRIDPMGAVLIMLFLTLLLSIVLGWVSGKRIKALFPVVIAVCFLPTVPIFYNESALIHALWYLALSAIGLLVGTVTRIFFGWVAKAK